MVVRAGIKDLNDVNTKTTKKSWQDIGLKRDKRVKFKVHRRRTSKDGGEISTQGTGTRTSRGRRNLNVMETQDMARGRDTPN